MGYYSDPTAAAAMGNINREFSKQEKKAKRLLELYEKGKLSDEEFEAACSQFKGIFRRVPVNVIKNETT